MSDFNIERIKAQKRVTVEQPVEQSSVSKPELLVFEECKSETEKDTEGDVFETSNDKTTEKEENLSLMPNHHRIRNKEAKERKEKASEMRKRVENTQEHQGPIGKAWNGVKNFFHMNNGTNNVDKEITEFEQKKRSEDSVNNRIQRYEQGQKQVVEVVADIGSYAAAAGCYTAALGGAVAAPFTGGTSAGVAVTAIAGASAAGAAAKAAIKGADAALGRREYTLKDSAKDAATGALNGPIVAATAGVGYGVAKAVGKMGVQSAAQTAAAMEQQVVVGLGKATTKATVAEVAEYAAKESANVTLTASKEAIKAAPVREVRKTGEILLGHSDKKALQTVTGIVANSTENTSKTILIEGAKESIAAKAAYKVAQTAAQGATFGGTASLGDYVAEGVTNGKNLSFAEGAARFGTGAAAGAIFNTGMTGLGEIVSPAIKGIGNALPNGSKASVQIPTTVRPAIAAEQALTKASNSGVIPTASTLTPVAQSVVPKAMSATVAKGVANNAENIAKNTITPAIGGLTAKTAETVTSKAAEIKAPIMETPKVDPAKVGSPKETMVSKSNDEINDIITQKYGNGKYSFDIEDDWAAKSTINGIIKKEYDALRGKTRTYTVTGDSDIASVTGQTSDYTSGVMGLDGWHRRFFNFGNPVERVSLQVNPSKKLIEELDKFCKENNVDQYKTPTAFDKWFKREDPITIYFNDNITQSQLAELEKITRPYIRQDAVDSQVGVNYSKGISYSKNIDGSTEKAIEYGNRLVKRARSINDDLAEIIEDLVFTRNDDVINAELSAGQYRAVEKFLDTVSGIQAPSELKPLNSP